MELELRDDVVPCSASENIATGGLVEEDGVFYESSQVPIKHLKVPLRMLVLFGLADKVKVLAPATKVISTAEARVQRNVLTFREMSP